MVSHSFYTVGDRRYHEANGSSGNDYIQGRSRRGDLGYVNGQAGNDTLMGGSGDETLFGGSGNDRLNGNIGNDTLIGGAGNDYLHGGDGRDTFEFYSSDRPYLDLIDGFNINQDKIFLGGRDDNYQLEYGEFAGSTRIDTRIYLEGDLIAVVEDVEITQSNFSKGNFRGLLGDSTDEDSTDGSSTDGDSTDGGSTGGDPPAGGSVGYTKTLINSQEAAQYLASHQDLIKAFGNGQHAYERSLELATEHYSNNGIQENRVLDNFDEAQYLASHQDLINAFGNGQHSYERSLELATEHYITFGARENRALDSFNEVSYLSNYADLQAAFRNDLDAATEHYITFGASEGRVF